MRSTLFLMATLVGFIPLAQSQERSLVKPALRSIYLEAGGTSVFGSINFDRIFILQKNYALAYRLGIAALPINPLRPAPVGEITVLTGQSNHHAEFGIGALLYYRQKPSVQSDKLIANPVLFPRIGYRYQKPEGGLLFRVGFTPGISLNRSSYLSWPGSAIFWWGGISIGRSF